MSRNKWPCEEHPLYSRWLSITQRCTNPNSANYHRYGARGIKLADDLKRFEDYAAYVESLPGYGEPGVTLDRINNDLGYQKGNLRWATKSMQNANRETSGKGNNKYTGINWSITHERWIARVSYKGKVLMAKVFLTQREALEARNQFIMDNHLPHTVQQWMGE